MSNIYVDTARVCLIKKDDINEWSYSNRVTHIHFWGKDEEKIRKILQTNYAARFAGDDLLSVTSKSEAVVIRNIIHKECTSNNWLVFSDEVTAATYDQLSFLPVNQKTFYIQKDKPMWIFNVPNNDCYQLVDSNKGIITCSFIQEHDVNGNVEVVGTMKLMESTDFYAVDPRYIFKRHLGAYFTLEPGSYEIVIKRSKYEYECDNGFSIKKID